MEQGRLQSAESVCIERRLRRLLEKGTIDATEWVGPYDDEKLGFYKVAKYYYYPGWWEGGTALHFFINTDKWNALPKAYKSLLTVAAGYANMDVQARYDARNPQALKRLVAAGTQLRPFSQAIMEACLKACRFRKLRPLGSRSPANQNILLDVRNCLPFRPRAVRWLQVATTARSRNPGAAASTQRPAAACAASAIFNLG